MQKITYVYYILFLSKSLHVSAKKVVFAVDKSYKASTSSLVRPVTLAINSISAPSSFIFLAISDCFLAEPSARPLASPSVRPLYKAFFTTNFVHSYTDILK